MKPIWSKEKNQDKAIKVMLFVISPFIAALYALRRMNTKSSYWVFFGFAVFFGMAFTIESGKTAGSGALDGSAYRGWFEEDMRTSYSEYINGLEGFLTFDEGKKDYYFETISFYISRFTDNYHLMFMAVAIVFAFFALKSFKFLTQEENFDYSISSIILIYLFLGSNDIFNINGLRFWTAAWIGVFCIFHIFRNNDKKYLLLIFLTPFVHGSFWIFIGIVLLAYFFKRYEKLWIILFFVSFVVGSIAVEIIANASDSLPTFVQRMVNSYTDAERIKRIEEGGAGFIWVRRSMEFLVRFTINFTVYLFIRNSKIIKTNLKTKNIYLFLLVWMTFVNFTMAVPSLGNRYFQLAFPLIAYIWLVNFRKVKYQKFLYMIPFVFWFVMHKQLERYMMVLEPEFFVSSPFYLIYKNLIAF